MAANLIKTITVPSEQTKKQHLQVIYIIQKLKFTIRK